jgi:indole-3-glycerol phosphate synthase
MLAEAAMILDDIVAQKRHEHALRDPVLLDELWAQVAALPPARPFADAIRTPGTLRAVAEFKRRSPSAGEIRPDADPADVAARYQRAGAAAISILTDARFFDGSSADLRAAHAAVSVPLLRKDFLFDERDLLQSRLAGADAVLLIVRILDAATLRALVDVAKRAGLAALV